MKPVVFNHALTQYGAVKATVPSNSRQVSPVATIGQTAKQEQPKAPQKAPSSRTGIGEVHAMPWVCPCIPQPEAHPSWHARICIVAGACGISRSAGLANSALTDQSGEAGGSGGL